MQVVVWPAVGLFCKLEVLHGAISIAKGSLKRRCVASCKKKLPRVTAPLVLLKQLCLCWSQSWILTVLVSQWVHVVLKTWKMLVVHKTKSLLTLLRIENYLFILFVLYEELFFVRTTPSSCFAVVDLKAIMNSDPDKLFVQPTPVILLTYSVCCDCFY